METFFSCNCIKQAQGKHTKKKGTDYYDGKLNFLSLVVKEKDNQIKYGKCFRYILFCIFYYFSFFLSQLVNPFTLNFNSMKPSQHHGQEASKSFNLPTPNHQRQITLTVKQPKSQSLSSIFLPMTPICSTLFL